MYRAYMKMLRYTFIPTVLITLLFGCKKFEPEYSAFSELGTTQSEYIVPADSGSIDVFALSNDYYDIIVPDSNQWISAKVKSGYKDTTFKVSYETNTEFARMGYVILSSHAKERFDTITIKQRGSKIAEIRFPENNLSVMGDGGSISAELMTNLSLDQINIEIIYPTDEELGEDDNNQVDSWVNDDFSYDDAEHLLKFSVKNNPDKTELRSAEIRFSFTNGWGEIETSSLFLLQANADNLFGTKATFADVQTWEGSKIGENIFIEGYVVSDNAGQNMGDNIQSTPTKIDFTPNQSTVYIEDVNGERAFRIITATPEDNVFKRYSRVQVLVKGREVSKLSGYNAYTISGVKSSDIMSQVAQTASDIPRKEKRMSELNDDDIYSYVTLKDCEIPVKKGPFVPINEGYGPVFNAFRITKYPMIIRDVAGDDMYLITNVTVPYARDGDPIPQGSGTISGIVVHETFTRFNYDDTPNPDNYGNIGKYQIRPVARPDINLNSDFNQGFSQILTEFSYPNLTSGKAYPTNQGNENGLLYASNNVNVYASTDYSYLGPVGANNLGNTNPLGTGILVNGVKQNVSTGTNSDGKGGTSGGSIAASRIWWDYTKDRGEAYIVEFSTAGVSTNVLSIQFAALNWGQKSGPRYWRIEWSEIGDMDGNDWKPIGKYTVPDVANWSNTLLSQLPAYKNMSFNLPLEMLGKSKVFIRLIVDQNLGSDSFSYIAGPLETAVNSALSYLSIRYNK